MRMLNHTTERTVSAGLLVFRAVLGLIFVAHGAQKLFVYGLDGVGAGFAQMGIPAPEIAATIVAFGELLGGTALLAGVLTRLAAAGLAVIMAGAMAIAHLPNGFFNPGGIEFTLSLFGGAILLALTGAGRWSLDGFVAAGRSPALVTADRERARRAA